MFICSSGLGKDELVVTPARACQLLAIGRTRLYEHLNAGELTSYTDGRSRRITLKSIHDFVARRIATNHEHDTP
jgi:excisionase family DNA binding protein